MPKLNYGRGSRSKNAEKIGKGKVTPVQVAFIVDRYLLDNNFAQTRAAFRLEAANFLAKSPVQEAPKSLLSLGELLDEYIHLKGQKVTLEQERRRTEQDKFRVDKLLNGLQTAMNAFNASAPLVTPPPQLPAPLQPPLSVNSAIPSSSINEHLPVGSTPGYYSVHPSPAVITPFKPLNPVGENTSASKQTNNYAASKRKPFADTNLTTKRTRRSFVSTNQPKLREPSAADNGVTGVHQPLVHTHGSMVNGSNSVQNSQVVKCLFTNYTDPKTPPLPSSSQVEKTASPVQMCEAETSSKDTTPQQITSTNCTIISSETIHVSPEKQISYYSIERNRCISTSSSPAGTPSKKGTKRDHVKGRLDFDAPEVNTEHQLSNDDDILDLDFANLDALESINIHKLLSDFDLTEEGTSCSSPGATDSSPESYSWSPENSTRVEMGNNQVYSQLLETVTEIHSGQDPNSSGSDPYTTVKSVTKTIKILSPAKNQRSRSEQEKLPVEDILD